MTRAEREKLAKYRRTKEYMVSDPAYLEYQMLLAKEREEKSKKVKIDQDYWT